MTGLQDKVIVLRGEGMGEGDPVLGSTILASFLRLCLEDAQKPKAIFCYNGGVKLLTEDSLVLPLLQELAASGVKLEACRTCIDFYGIRERLKAGEISSMSRFMEYLQNEQVVIL